MLNAFINFCIIRVLFGVCFELSACYKKITVEIFLTFLKCGGQKRSSICEIKMTYYEIRFTYYEKDFTVTHHSLKEMGYKTRKDINPVNPVKKSLPKIKGTWTK